MQSAAYVEHFIQNNDIVFLSETWVKPGQDDILFDMFDESAIGHQTDIFGKSGMDNAPDDYTGRPYGGVAFICKSNDTVCYQQIPCSSDRVVAIKILSRAKRHIATIIGAYMPFYDRGNVLNTDNYLDTLDAIQVIIDEYAPLGPISLVGDFNAQLPNKEQIRPNWYRSNGYTAHSKILFDFLTANDLICADFKFKQIMYYSYFQFENNAFTWIDHVFISNHSGFKLKKCVILDHEIDNVSDHLPLLTVFDLNVGQDTCPVRPEADENRARPNWDNYLIRDKYCNLVNDYISGIPDLCMGNLKPNSDEAHSMINDYISNINSCLFRAASEVSHGRKNKQYRPKHFWCPTLSKLRDTKRFWWKMWCDNGRARHGHVFEIWKMCKKSFRKYYRSKSCDTYNVRFSKLNSLFIKGKPFWNLLKPKRKKHSMLNDNVDGFTDHFTTIMNENGNLTQEQQTISDEVNDRYESVANDFNVYEIDTEHIRSLLAKLKKRCAPGFDGVTAEHLLYASSDTFCSVLARMYENIFRYNIVPDVLKVGVIIPILKKSTLDVSAFNNYRPITLSSVYAKLLELMMIPDSDISVNQYGYQRLKGADFCCAMLNDLISVYNDANTPVYMCSLDAEKCFDSIWHDGLLYKLTSHMSTAHWRLLYQWYKSLCAIVRINGFYGNVFTVSKGTRQGSILSPYVFNIFIDNLLKELENSPCGLRVGKSKFNSLAYADDIELLATHVSDLQCLVDICYEYSVKWRFKFGENKSLFFIAGNKNVAKDPNIILGSVSLKRVDRIDVLGKVFTSNGASTEHMLNRMKKSRQALHAMGYRNEELCPAVKDHIWKSVGAPSLLYSMCTGPLSTLGVFSGPHE